MSPDPKIDVMKQREPAKAEFTRGSIDRAMEFTEIFRTPTFGHKAREIIKAAAVFYIIRHRGQKFIRQTTPRPEPSGDRGDFQDEPGTIRNRFS